MSFNIDPQVALEAYEHAKKDLEELEAKKQLLLESGVEISGLDAMLDAMIKRRKDEMLSCAYYAFGDDLQNQS